MGSYDPTWESLDRHAVPSWYRDAKLGIFVHWGVYSVPAWAPTEGDWDSDLWSKYAEWYPYYMYQEGSPTREHHREAYGESVEYVDFAEEWTAEEFDPSEWAEIFADAGAGYVVLTGEHHDGFPLWDSHYTEYDAASMGPERDLVGELADAVREEELRFAASYHANHNYYQPGFEGRFGHPDVEPDGPGPEYVDFMNAKHRELIRKYDPDLLWFDLPKADSDHLETKALIADYYNRAEDRGKEVAVNDRGSLDMVGPVIDTDDSEVHGDFVTPEYATFDEIRDEVWETCRGIGQSFGYNRLEDDEHYLPPADLIRSFVDIVSKNGNLLLNVGPRADGTIPELQLRRLRALGDWLSVNGEAIFGTRPWVVAEEDEGPNLRYTHRDDTLYAILLEWPDEDFSLPLGEHVDVESTPWAGLLTRGGERPLDARLAGDELAVSLPADPPHNDVATAVALSGVPNPRT